MQLRLIAMRLRLTPHAYTGRSCSCATAGFMSSTATVASAATDSHASFVPPPTTRMNSTMAALCSRLSISIPWFAQLREARSTAHRRLALASFGSCSFQDCRPVALPVIATRGRAAASRETAAPAPAERGTAPARTRCAPRPDGRGGDGARRGRSRRSDNR